ncbi:hypothetical protein [Nonomuraea sp. NPDC052265]|uniref:hypothetical protein n=1 Tax=Nonomuraea sp. NPDC052265 TaxID=3364374 RepID=UPI0037CC5D08
MRPPTRLRGPAVTALAALGLTALHATPAAAANILSNPGFESGLNGWTCPAGARGAPDNFVGFWSAARDNGGCPNGQVSPTCSGISQSSYEFTNIFKGFTG